MNKTAELAIVVGAIVALACVAIAAIAITGAVTAATWSIFQGFVVVMATIFVVGVVLIADETKKKKRIDYMLKKAGTV